MGGPKPFSDGSSGAIARSTSPRNGLQDVVADEPRAGVAPQVQLTEALRPEERTYVLRSDLHTNCFLCDKHKLLNGRSEREYRRQQIPDPPRSKGTLVTNSEIVCSAGRDGG